MCGTLSSFLTAKIPERRLHEALHLPDDAIHYFIVLAFLVGVGASLMGRVFLMIDGVRKVAPIEVGNHRIPGWVQAVGCLVACLPPWGFILEALPGVWAVGI